MSNARGISFEKEVAHWMRSELGYTSTELRVPIKGKVADRAYEVDIHAEKFSPGWDYLRRIGNLSLVLAVAIYFLPSEFYSIRNFIEGIVAGFNPAWTGSAMLIFSVLAIIAGYFGRSGATRHAWVECKNLKTNVKRVHVQKLISSVDDVLELEDENSKWKPDEVIFVSGSDFDVDALNFAREFDVICYRRLGTTFQRAD